MRAGSAGPPTALRGARSPRRWAWAGVEPMQPMAFLFLSDGRLFIRHASGQILEAEASARGPAALLMLALDEIATGVDPARGLELLPPAQS